AFSRFAPNGANSSSMLLAKENPMSLLLAPAITWNLHGVPGHERLLGRLSHDLAVDHRTGIRRVHHACHVQAIRTGSPSTRKKPRGATMRKSASRAIWLARSRAR